ncbi:uncharacterized protein N7498_004480, partial [Penicillium cinerascens]
YQAKGKSCNYNRPGAAGDIPRKLSPRETPQHVPDLVSPPSSPAHSFSPAHSIEVSSTSTSLTLPGIESHAFSDNNRESNSDSNLNRPYYAAHGRFAGQVAAAIEERAGRAPPATTYLVPLVDAPLFGDLDLPLRSSPLSESTELPSRARADQLVNIYWRHIHPVEPVLDYDQFSQIYAKSFSTEGCLAHTDHHIQLSILNVIFALAVQRQEWVPFNLRNEEGNTYFQRAWALFPTESIIWEPGSLERVQCLMLMNRYLHCTTHQQKTWMTAGLAMRIAQTMCCNSLETPLGKDAGNDARLKRKVWASCVALDRCVSWSLGKTSVLALIPWPTSDCQQGSDTTGHSRWKLELHEIGNQIQMAQIQTRSTLASRSAVPRLDQQEEYHTAAVRLDACLNKWETSLPNDLQLRNLKFLDDRTVRMERYLIHLRFLHSRIYLYRPILARFYSMKSNGQSRSTNPATLSERLLRECAKMCVDAAQGVTALVTETLEPCEPIDIIPWWTRIYYLHIAGVIFLVAMVGSDLFTDSVAQSWQDFLAGLRAHVHLSTYIQQCICTFEALSAKILQPTGPVAQSGCEPLVEGAGVCFDDIFQDFRFDFDEFLFRTEEVLNFDVLGS